MQKGGSVPDVSALAREQATAQSSYAALREPRWATARVGRRTTGLNRAACTRDDRLLTAQGVYLEDFAALSLNCRELGRGLPEFLRADCVRSLAWPDDVVEQWLYDHSGFSCFTADYGELDLATIRWHDERVPASEFLSMPTGPSESGLIEKFARDPDHWSGNRLSQGVPQHWEAHGTWRRRPLLIDRALLKPSVPGLQVIEGRTRVGVLRGFLERGRPVASAHSAWVARRP